MTQIVTTPDGTTHEFPDEATPDMIAGALGVQAPQGDKVAPGGLSSLITGQKPPPNGVVDVAESGASGVVRGAAESAMLPLTIPRLVDEYVLQPTVGRAAKFTLDSGEGLVRHILGMPPVTPEEEARREKVMAEHGSPLYKAQDAVRAGMDSVLHKPETTAGEYANTIGEFAAPGGVMGKGSKIARAVGDVIVPAVTSETAGQVFKDTPLEGPARFIAAILGNAGTGAARARTNAPTKAVVDSVGKDLTPEQWAAATGLSQNKFGVNVSGPNALQQATNDGTMIGDLQRVVEGSLKGGAVTKPYFNQVPGQVDAAVGQTLDDIAPASAAPSTIGPRAQEAAQTVLDDTRKGINDSTKPLYEAASTQKVTPDTQVTTVRKSPILDERGEPMVTSETKTVPTPVSTDPRYGDALTWVRKNLPEFKGFPDNSVEITDQVSKRLFDTADAARNSSNSTFSNQIAALSGDVATDVRDTARSVSPAYEKALETQKAERAAKLDPLEQGPVGKIARSGETKGATEAVLPSQPLTGGEHEIATAITRIGEKDPELAALLVRQGLADSYDTNASRLVGGDNYYGGARFAKDVAGTAQKEKNVQAAIAALPGKRNPAAFGDLIDVLRATGRRKPQGSATSFNNEIQNDLGAGSALSRTANVAKSGGAAFLTNVNDKARRIWLGKNVESLASLFVDPDSVQKIKSIVEKGAVPVGKNTATTAAVTAPQQSRERNKPLRIDIHPTKKAAQ